MSTLKSLAASFKNFFGGRKAKAATSAKTTAVENNKAQKKKHKYTFDEMRRIWRVYKDRQRLKDEYRAYHKRKKKLGDATRKQNFRRNKKQRSVYLLNAA